MVKKPLKDLKSFDALEYPIKFAIKIIMLAGAGNTKNINELNIILAKLSISLQEPWTFVESSKGNYISYTGLLIVDTKSQMYALYGELSSHPNIKYAI
jgi:putative lipoic acid-binding regulatory protein